MWPLIDKLDLNAFEYSAPGYEKKIDYGKERPNSAPSVFKCVSSSSIPTPVPPQRTTKKSTSSARTFMEDEIDAFNKEDIICSFEFLKSKINKLSSSHNSAVLKNILDDEVQIQSKKTCYRHWCANVSSQNLF